jgi:two-component system, OmpR family, response regulator
MRILIVEDEIKIANALKLGLQQESYAVDAVYTGTEGMSFATTEPYDLVILDRMLPGVDGLEICKAMRAKQINTPVLMLTARDQITDRVAGLQGGADDYLVKPFAYDEMLARVQALLRRPVQLQSDILQCGDLVMDVQTRAVTRAGIRVMLSMKESALLEYMLRNQGQPITKDQLIGHVWDYDADVLPNTVEVYIGYVRTKIDKAFPKSVPLITTVRGLGYQLGASHV